MEDKEEIDMTQAHAYETPHSRQHYLIEGFADDFGNIIIPGHMEYSAYASRYYHYRGYL